MTVGFTDLATVGDADRFVGVAFGALLVVFALDAPTASNAVQAFGAVFVRTADTAIVFGTDLGRRVLVTTLFIFQTGDTATAGPFFQDQATFLTGLTAGNEDRGVTTTACLKQKTPHQQGNKARPEYTSHRFFLQH